MIQRPIVLTLDIYFHGFDYLLSGLVKCRPTLIINPLNQHNPLNQASILKQCIIYCDVNYTGNNLSHDNLNFHLVL